MNKIKQFILRFWIKFKLQFGAYFYAVYPSKKLAKFVILCQGRTGSTLLVDLLNAHPQIGCEMEIFRKQRHLFHAKLWFPYLFLKGMEVACQEQVFGFKVMIPQLSKHQGIPPNVFLDRLQSKGYKIIYLLRENLLEQALSAFIAQKTGQYHFQQQPQKMANQIEVPIEALKMRMDKSYQLQNKELACLDGRSFFKVIYEKDLLNNDQHQRVANQIFDFLGISKTPVKTSYRKLAGKSPEKQLKNYEELNSYFANTPYAQFFKNGQKDAK